MRMLAAALLSLTLLAGSALAALPNSSTPAASPAASSTAGHAFGTTFCPPIECLDSRNSLSPSDLASNATRCFHDNFGYDDVSELFSQSSGLDSNNCLSAKSNVLPTRGGTPLAPVCCVIEQNKVCKFRCSIVTAN